MGAVGDEATAGLVRLVIGAEIGTGRAGVADDRRVVEEYVRTLNDQLDLAEGVSILENTDLAPGGCRVRNQFGSVDQSIETQLELIEERLFGEVGVRS